MWKVSRINNSTHSVSLKHTDGEIMEMIVPAEHTKSSNTKMSYIKQKTDARSVIKDIEYKQKIKLIAEHKKRIFRLYSMIFILLGIGIFLVVRMY
jgi:hypothetical protein